METSELLVPTDVLGVHGISHHGPSPAAVLQRYTDLTGRVPLFPLWALGYHQSRWSYFPAQSVRRVARDFRQTHAVPCDAIHLDIHYMDGNRCFTWDPSGFPDPAGLIADLHAQGFRIVTIIDPGIKADRGYRVFRDGLDQDVFCRYPDGGLCVGPVWPGNCAFPDFTHPRGRAWWGDLHARLLDAGVDGIWADMNEPALFGEHGATLPGPARHDLEGHPGDHRRAHNVYGLQMARATAEGLVRLRPERRPVGLTRSGWAGAHRYAAHGLGSVNVRIPASACGYHSRHRHLAQQPLPLRRILDLHLLRHRAPDEELLAHLREEAFVEPLPRRHLAAHAMDEHLDARDARPKRPLGVARDLEALGLVRRCRRLRAAREPGQAKVSLLKGPRVTVVLV